MKMLLDIVEKFLNNIGIYRELVLAVLIDARGVPDERPSADDALRMMQEIEASNTLDGPSPKRATARTQASIRKGSKPTPRSESKAARAA